MYWRSALVAFLCLFVFGVGRLGAAERSQADAVALAAEIDRLVNEKLQAAGVSAAARADDAAFFRRLNLALGGRVPVSSETRGFLADQAPDKRARAIERLLSSAAYANHMTVSWTGWLLPEAATDPNVANAAPGFEAWLRGRIRDEVSFDRIASELLTYALDGRGGANQPTDDDAGMSTSNGPLAFYTAKDGKPENLAAATARVFLGVHLECAQCHDHPMARWKRDQFWGLAAFFGGIEKSAGGGFRETKGKRELLIPNSSRAVPATLLDDREPDWQYKKSLRATLAAWVTAADNPFFARAIANRLWWLLFGIGLVDPVDDFHDQNPPSHPELLNALARAFVQSGFDVKFIVRAICLSETFGRSSAPTSRGASAAGPTNRLFAHFPMQGLSPEQLYDSLAVVLGDRSDVPGDEAAPRSGPARRQFLEAFALNGQRTENPTTILQALTLMNGGQVGAATNLQTGRLLRTVVKLPGLTPSERIEALYFAVLSRPPRPLELERALAHIQDGKEGADNAHADVLWALLNSIEFRTNH